MNGLVLREEGRVPEAIRMLEELVERYPSHAQGHAYLGHALREVGYFADAVRHHTRAMELEPRDFIHPVNLCEDFLANGSARGLDTRSLALYYQGTIRRSNGDHEGARESFLRARESLEKGLAWFPRGVALRSWHAVLQALCGEASRAVVEADAIQRDEPGYVQLACARSLVCAALHDREGLLSWLSNLRTHGMPIWWGLRNDPGFSEYADDPSFISVIGA